MVNKNNMAENKGKPIMNGNSYAKELKVLPDHSNEATRATESRLGPFIYDKDDLLLVINSSDVVMRGPYELDNGAIYHGMWSREG